MKSEPPLVAHVIYAFGTGGLENGLVNLINRSPSDRYRHAVICLTSSGQFAGRLADSHVSVIALNKRPGHDLGVYWRLWKALRQVRPSIVHTRNLAALEMHLVGVFLPRVKRIHGEHGRDIYDIDGSNRRYRQLRRLISPLLTRFTTVSADLQRWLVDDVGIDARKVTQIYNGVDQRTFHPRQGPRPDLAPTGFLNEAQTLVGTVGRLAEVKDQATLLNAVELLVAKNPGLRQKLRVVIVGDGPMRQSLQDKIERAGLNDVVWMPGDRDDVPVLLRMIDVFVLPSLAEGVSNTILEAMSSGLPVVATDTGGNPELVEPSVNGFLFEVGDAQGLADILSTCLGDNELLHAMGKAARQRVEQRFNWQHTVDQYLSVYDHALGISNTQ